MLIIALALLGFGAIILASGIYYLVKGPHPGPTPDPTWGMLRPRGENWGSPQSQKKVATGFLVAGAILMAAGLILVGILVFG
jgi:hypothetical protein